MGISTPDTTRIDSIVFGLLMSAFAAVIVIFAVQYFRPVWKYAETEQKYTSVLQGHIPGDLELDALTRSLRQSPDVSHLSRAAFVQLLRAQQLGVKSIRSVPRLTAARRDLLIGIAAAPSDAYAWTRLAIVNLELERPKDAARALSLALQLAPTERGLTPMHFDLCVVLWNELTAIDRTALAQRLKWAQQQPAMKNVIQGNSARALKQLLKGKAASR